MPAATGGFRDAIVRPRVPIQVTGGRLHLARNMSTRRADNSQDQHLELPVEELLRRARPLPPYDEMVIEDLSAEEGAAFLAAADS